MKNSRNLILLGGGGHCKSIIDVAESAGFNILGILDIPENVGKSICGIEITGTDDEIIKYVDRAQFIVSVGYMDNNSLRLKLYNRVKQLGGTFAAILASTAHVSKHAKIGEGTAVMRQACVNADATVGNNCIINTFANIEHDVQMGNHVHISTGAMINGNCMIGESVFVGSQSTVRQGVHIAANVYVGASSFVNRDIQEPGIYVGIPVRKLSEKS
jgi:sugar O-acyltransferase (sialic acid O-acetyltransferase NeuD family)